MATPPKPAVAKLVVQLYRNVVERLNRACLAKMLFAPHPIFVRHYEGFLRPALTVRAYLEP
jgi:hypothetical protein